MMPQIIFKYSIAGYAESFIDPVAVRRSLLRETDGTFWECVGHAHDLEQAASEYSLIERPTEAAELAQHDARGRHIQVQLATKEDTILKAAYAVFGWPTIDPQTGEGVPEVEALRVIKEFLEYAEKKD